MNKENPSTTPENEPTNNQWEDPEIPKNMEDMPLRIDLNGEAFQSKFADAEIMAKKGTINAEQITEDGLANGVYADIYFDDADNKYKMNTYVMEGEGEDRHRRLENTHDVSPGMWIATNPKQQEADYPNSYPIEDQKFHKLYESSGDNGVYKPKGLAKLIPNDTGREVEIELPESWGGGLMGGAKDCFFRQPCDIDGNPTGRPSIIAADAVETTYGPLAEVRPDLVDDSSEDAGEKMTKQRLEELIITSPAVERFTDNAFSDYGMDKRIQGFFDSVFTRHASIIEDAAHNLFYSKEAKFDDGGKGYAFDSDEEAEKRLDAIDHSEKLPDGSEKTDVDAMRERKLIAGILYSEEGWKKFDQASLRHREIIAHHNPHLQRGSDPTQLYSYPYDPYASFRGKEDSWSHPEKIDADSVYDLAHAYPTALDFREAAVAFIQKLGASEGGPENHEEKREEYRRAAKDLERIIYGEEQSKATDDILEALAIAKAIGEPSEYLKRSINIFERPEGSKAIWENARRDEGETYDHVLDDFDENLRLREHTKGKNYGWWFDR